MILPAHDPDEPVMALNVDVGDGRPIPRLVLGKFGAAVIRDLPDASVARHQGPYWEAMSDQGWVRIESRSIVPLAPRNGFVAGSPMTNATTSSAYTPRSSHEIQRYPEPRRAR